MIELPHTHSTNYSSGTLNADEGTYLKKTFYHNSQYCISTRLCVISSETFIKNSSYV